ncbi:Ig-like domain-containing protein [Cytophaga aurantiaca]|uniref:Ig-like domain-containing protein n=1 Tax=Cytophaga aurantiaca TaxID=29530 RepID=UPI0003A3AEFB|nr:Ig-like domain-containing protein [Cytophaga aurantiaca]
MKASINRSKIIFLGIIFGSIALLSPAFGQAFKHPGILNNQSELDFIKEKSKSGIQPWKKAYDVLKASPFASLNYISKPLATMDCWSYNKDKNGNYVPQCKTFVEDGMAAYSCALMWYITEDKRYADKSIQILNGWSNVYVSNTGSNARLNVSWAAPWFINAAEILRHGNAGGASGWSQSDITKFNGMLAKFLPYVKDENMAGNNWIQSAIEAHFAIAIFTDNRAEFNNAVGRWKTRVKTYIYQKSDGATPLTYPSGHVDINSSKWNGTRTFIDGLCMETCRDLGHLKLGINSMMYAAQSAYEQGIDLFSLEQKRLSDFFELHGSWMTGAKAVPSNINGGLVIASPNTPGIKPPNGGGGAAFEIAYNHLHSRLNKNLPYTLQMINAHRPASAGQWVFKWETLTHGDLPFNLTTTPPNQAPTVNVTSPQSTGTNYASAAITLNATASDDKGVTKVEFYNGPTLLNSDATAPYAFTWTNVGAGTYNITAKAYDADNASKTSATITISVIAKQVVDYTPPQGFTLAANENTMIPITDKVNIAYGVNGTFVYLYNQTSSVGCTNEAFGSDPANGIAKKCFVQKVIAPPAVNYAPPAGYTVTANEWGTVIVTGKMNIAYGANGTFTYLYNQTSNIACTNDAFNNDPVNGVSKKCYVQQVPDVPVITNPSTIGVNGPTCVEPGKTYTYTVKPDAYTLRSANWWSNTGAIITMNPANESIMTITIPSNTAGLNLKISSGVNITVDPWYKEYSMQVKVGGCTGSTPQLRAAASPQPFNANTTLSLEDNEKINSIVVLDMNGVEVYKAANIDAATFELGDNLAVGMYIAHIHSNKGVSVIKLVKNQ